MEQQERAALERLAERGSPAGADAVVAAAVAEVGRSRRRPARVAVGAFAAAAVVAAVVAASTFAYVRVKLGDVERIDLSADLAGSADVSGPMTVLLVGSDSRAGLDAEDRERFGGPEQVAAARADTIMVLRVDPEAGTAAVLSLPRDLWLPIDGAGAEQRINTALAGGPGVLVRTVQSALGIELDHYVQIDFDGFRRIVDAVGGVTVRVDVPLRDRVTGLDLPDVGCRELSGEQALVRSRSLERQEEGRWRSDPTGDLGRIEWQRQFLLAMLADVPPV